MRMDNFQSSRTFRIGSKYPDHPVREMKTKEDLELQPEQLLPYVKNKQKWAKIRV